MGAPGETDGAPRSFDAAWSFARALARTPNAPWEARVDAYEHALAIGEAEEADPRALALAYNEVGGLCMEGEAPEIAAEAFARACDHDPTLADAHANLGGALSAAGDHEGALAAFRRALARSPNHTGYLEVTARELRRLRRDDEAAEVYARWHAIDPTDPVAAHHAVRLGAPPPQASAAYLRREFDAFSARFDELLRNELRYQAPELVTAAARHALGDRARDLVIADLGCGTGLCGPILRPWARRLVGVDLSPGMLQRAAERGYDERVEAEIAAYCAGAPDTFDLLVAADVFNYLGDLAPVLRAARVSLIPGGILAFSAEMETTAEGDWSLRVDGRYRHARAYLEARLADAGMALLRCEEGVLRVERGAPVRGWIVSARRPHDAR